jgi:hypothetical protein
MLLGDTIHLAFAMLPHAPHEIIGHALQYAVSLACHDGHKSANALICA